jgi:hypothetical protein
MPELGLEDRCKARSSSIAQTKPHEMEQLVGQDEPQITRLLEQSALEYYGAVANETRGVHGRALPGTSGQEASPESG